MDGHDEVIARFIPELLRHTDSGLPTASILVRTADGRMVLQPVDPDPTLGQEALATGAFRKGNPIVDPASRRILGYEMEPAHSMTLRVVG